MSANTLKIFISGPMTGHDDYNFPKFDRVERLMTEHGFNVVNPANICRKYKREKVLADNDVFDEMIVEEQQVERTCNAILLLDGWENSVGCKREIKTAKELAFTFYHENDFKFLNPARIGIFGGTFDPFTRAHYEILSRVGLDKVVILPTTVDYYRKDKKPLFSYDQRRRIIDKWLEFGDHDSGIVADYYEYEHTWNEGSKRCYCDMLRDAKKRYGAENGYFTILGMDSWANITNWRKSGELLEESEFIVVNRGSTGCESKFDDCYLSVSYGGKKYTPYSVMFLDENLHDVSATKTREEIVFETGLDSEQGMKWYIGLIEKYFKKFNVKYSLDSVEEMLGKIRKYLDDPYKDDLTKYSLIEDVVNGKV